MSKRLADAELAAEMHAAVATVYRLKKGPGRPRATDARERDTALDRMLTLTRFAHAPHHDEQVTR